MSTMSDDLYDRDFYLWTQGQGAALRARRFGDNVLDIDRIAEELEDLGSAQRNKAESFVRRILEHFYKLSASTALDPVRHWLVEIVNFRAGFDSAVTPSIRIAVEAELEQLHVRSARDASKVMKVQEPHALIEPSLRWSLAQLLGEDDDPFDAFSDALEEAGRATPEHPH